MANLPCYYRLLFFGDGVCMCFLRVVLLSLACCASAWAAAPAPPNIAIFIMDDVGQSDLGTYGHSVVKTPNIDRLAREGMRFDNAFLTTSSCSSSRASILTGLYPHNTGAATLGSPVPASVDSLPQQLKRAGYYTASVGKWHLGEPFKSHFDRVVEMRDESGAIDWQSEFQRRPHNQPFFFWFASGDAHIPYDWMPPLALQYRPDNVVIHPWSVDNPYERVELMHYYNEISRADKNIGLMLEALQQAGVLDNTLIIVMSDNGAMFGGAKTSLYDEGLRTPLVLRYPKRIRAGTINSQLISAIDLEPSLLELADLAPLPDRPGVSFWPTVANPQHAVRHDIYAERNTHAIPLFERAVRTDHLLYKRNYLDRQFCDPATGLLMGHPARERLHAELYDMRQDPLAHHNLISNPEYRHDLAQLQQRMNDIMYHTTDIPPPLLFKQCNPLPWGQNIELQWPVDTEPMNTE